MANIMAGSIFSEAIVTGWPRTNPFITEDLLVSAVNNLYGKDSGWGGEVQGTQAPYPKGLSLWFKDGETRQNLIRHLRYEPPAPITISGHTFVLSIRPNIDDESKARTKQVRTAAHLLHKRCKQMDGPPSDTYIKCIYAERICLFHHSPVLFWEFRDEMLHEHDAIDGEKLCCDQTMLDEICQTHGHSFDTGEFVQELMGELNIDEMVIR